MKNIENVKNEFGGRLQKIQDIAVKNRKDFYDLINQAKIILEGKTIIINDERFNSQPYGTSRKFLKGKSFVYTKDIFLYLDDIGKLYIQPPGCNSTLLLDKCLINGKAGGHNGDI